MGVGARLQEVQVGEALKVGVVGGSARNSRSVRGWDAVHDDGAVLGCGWLRCCGSGRAWPTDRLSGGAAECGTAGLHHQPPSRAHAPHLVSDTVISCIACAWLLVREKMCRILGGYDETACACMSHIYLQRQEGRQTDRHRTSFGI